MQCPKCRSSYLMIRQKTGLERLRILFTGLREYRCRDCDARFRAQDRRSTPREGRMGVGVVPRHIA